MKKKKAAPSFVKTTEGKANKNLEIGVLLEDFNSKFDLLAEQTSQIPEIKSVLDSHSASLDLLAENMGVLKDDVGLLKEDMVVVKTDLGLIKGFLKRKPYERDPPDKNKSPALAGKNRGAG